MRHIKFTDMAESLLYDGWGSDGKDLKTQVTDAVDSRLTLCLLIDIAESLRVLRCWDFKQIPIRLMEKWTILNQKKSGIGQQ